jgi:hypothetical protein
MFKMDDRSTFFMGSEWRWCADRRIEKKWHSNRAGAGSFHWRFDPGDALGKSRRGALRRRDVVNREPTWSRNFLTRLGTSGTEPGTQMLLVTRRRANADADVDSGSRSGPVRVEEIGRSDDPVLWRSAF